MTDAAPTSHEIDASFTGPIIAERNSGWLCVVMPESGAFFGTRKAVKVSGHTDGVAFEATMMPMGDGTHMVPLKAALRTALGKGLDHEVTVRLTQRRS